MSRTKLLPCPFCGSDNVIVVLDNWAHCHKCNAESGPTGGKAAAIAAWNRRADQFRDATKMDQKQEAGWKKLAGELAVDLQKADAAYDEAVRLLRELADAAFHFCPVSCAEVNEFLKRLGNETDFVTKQAQKEDAQ
jgi:Lar family restriction alleviation protein